MFILLANAFTVAMAQQVPDAHSLKVVPSGGEAGPFISTWQPENHNQGDWAFFALSEYAEWSALRWLNAQDDNLDHADQLEPTVDYLTTLNLGGTWAFDERVAVGLSVPVWLVPVFADGAGTPGIGDARLSAPVGLRLPGADRSGLGISAIPHLDLPSGNETVSLGEQGARAGATMALGYGASAFGLALNLGAHTGLVRSENTDTFGPRAIAALGGTTTVTDSVDLGLELTAAPSLPNGDETDTALPLEAIFSARGKLSSQLTWRAGAAHTLAGDNALPLYRVFAGLGLVMAPDPEPDPEPVVAPQGRVRVITRTTTGKPVDAQVRFTGEKVLPPYDLGANGRGEYTLNPGAWRVLITAADFGSVLQDIDIKADGSEIYIIEVILQPRRVEVSKNEILIKEKILFAFDKATIEPVSMPLLQEVAATLMTHDWIKQVEVQGHTDATGKPEYNLNLSQKRVESVRKALIDYGIAPNRLVAKGYGETRPMASNETDDGRARNRRVQFMIEKTAE